MLKKEAFKSVIQVYVDDSTLEIGLIEAGINGNSEFAKGDLKELELAAIPVLQSLMIVSSESEGQQSVSYNLEGIKSRLLFIAKKHGLTDLANSLSGKPEIRSKSVW